MGTQTTSIPYYKRMPLEEDYTISTPKSDSIQTTYTQYSRQGRDAVYPYQITKSYNTNNGQTSVEESGQGPYGTSVYIKNVYDPTSPEPVQSDTLFGGVPIDFFTNTDKRRYENMFTSDKDQVILAGYPWTQSGLNDYWKTLKQVNKEKLMSYFDYVQQKVKQAFKPKDETL